MFQRSRCLFSFILNISYSFLLTWRVTEGHREREGRGVKFLESEAEGYEDFLVEKA